MATEMQSVLYRQWSLACETASPWTMGFLGARNKRTNYGPPTGRLIILLTDDDIED